MFTVAWGLNAVIPLFPLYDESFGLATDAQLAVYAAYAVALVPSLLMVGHASDNIGRKAVLIPAAVLFATSSVGFALAGSLSALMVARALQGIAHGAFWATGAAMIRDLVPDDLRERASLVVSTLHTGAVAAGAFVMGLAVTWIPSYTLLWLIHSAMVLAATILLWGVPESQSRRARWVLRPSFQLPDGHKEGFLSFLVPLIFALVLLNGMVMSLAPQFVRHAGYESPALTGSLVAILVSIATVVQPLLARLTAYRAIQAGMLVNCAGVAVLVVFVAWPSPSLLLIMAALVGTGSGLVFRGGFGMAELMAAPMQRAGVLSAFNVVMYGSLGIPTLLLGVLVERWGLLLSVSTVAVMIVSVVAFSVTLGTRRLAPGLKGRRAARHAPQAGIA